jgi:O-antigen ligase
MLLTSSDRRNWRLFYLLLFISITGALFATETRAALSGLALGCFLALVIVAKPRLRLWGVAALILLGLASALWILHTRHIEWIDPNDPGTRFRVLMWEDGLRLVRQHPWFGVGMESVRNHWQEWNIRGFAQYHVVSHFHSTFLQIAVERGLPALGAWLWFVIAYLVFLFRLVRKSLQTSPLAVGPAAGILAAFAAFITSSFVHYNLGEEQLVTLVFFLFGIAVALDRIVAAAPALKASDQV